MKYISSFKIWESKLPSPPQIISFAKPASKDVKGDLSKLFVFKGNDGDTIIYDDNEKEHKDLYFVSYKPHKEEISLHYKKDQIAGNDVIQPILITSYSPRIVYNTSRIVIALKKGLSRDAAEWMESELVDEPWEDAVKKAIRNGPVTQEDITILGEDPHKHRGTVAAKRYSV